MIKTKGTRKVARSAKQAREKLARSKPVPEVERISNILMGLAVHLSIISNQEGIDLSDPLDAIENIVRHIDDGEALT